MEYVKNDIEYAQNSLMKTVVPEVRFVVVVVVVVYMWYFIHTVDR